MMQLRTPESIAEDTGVACRHLPYAAMCRACCAAAIREDRREMGHEHTRLLWLAAEWLENIVIGAMKSVEQQTPPMTIKYMNQQGLPTLVKKIRALLNTAPEKP